jgi:hypothetical protein
MLRTPASEAFLRTVLATCRERVGTLKAGSHFWRAQHGHDWRLTGPEEAEIEIPCAYSASRMKPLPGRASDGRANPRGIPSLYVATTKETAMSEVRPWVGSYVSVGQLRMLQDVEVVDCTRGQARLDVAELPVFQLAKLRLLSVTLDGSNRTFARATRGLTSLPVRVKRCSPAGRGLRHARFGASCASGSECGEVRLQLIDQIEEVVGGLVSPHQVAVPGGGVQFVEAHVDLQAQRSFGYPGA